MIRNNEIPTGCVINRGFSSKSKVWNTLSNEDVKRIESVLSNQLETFKEQTNKLLDATFETIIEQQHEKIYLNYFKNAEFERIQEEFQNVKSQNENLIAKSDSLEEEIKSLGPKPKFKDRIIENFLFKFIWLILIAIVSVLIYINSETLKEVGENITNTFKKE